jgi:putative resolvase
VLSISKAAVFLGVSPSTLRRWDKKGIVKAFRTIGNHRRYDISSLNSVYANNEEITSQKIKERGCVCYARVSGHKQKQKGDLSRQLTDVKNHAFNLGYNHPICIKDVGSGLNPNRSGLKKLMKLVASGKISEIFVTYQDRLTRFGFPFIIQYCNLFNVHITEISNPTQKSVQQSLVDDMMALIACFSGKLYGMRSGKRRKHNSAKKKEEKRIKDYISKEIETSIKISVNQILSTCHNCQSRMIE